MTAEAEQAPEQLVLDLPHLAALGAEDFFVSRSNAQAAALVDAWPGWSAPAAVIAGPMGSGKSHLAHVWRARSGAVEIAASAVRESDLARLEESHALAVEDLDRGIGDERVLFHALNLTREKGYSMFLTSRVAPGELVVALPDLRSRLRALPVVVIEPPDEALLKAVLVKLFADRQLAVEPHVINHIALHMDRSMAVASRVVEEADRLALARKSGVSRALAAEALAAVSQARDWD